MFQLHFFISAIRNCLCKFSLNSCFTEDREPAAFHFLFWTNSLSLSHLSPLLHSITKYVYTKIETLIPFANKMKSKTLKSVLVCDGFFSSMEYFPVEKERSAIFKLQKWEKCSGIEFRKQVFSPDSKQLWHLWSKSNSFQTINVSRNWCGSQRLCIPIDGPLFFAHDTHTHTSIFMIRSMVCHIVRKYAFDFRTIEKWHNQVISFNLHLKLDVIFIFKQP